MRNEPKVYIMTYSIEEHRNGSEAKYLPEANVWKNEDTNTCNRRDTSTQLSIIEENIYITDKNLTEKSMAAYCNPAFTDDARETEDTGIGVTSGVQVHLSKSDVSLLLKIIVTASNCIMTSIVIGHLYALGILFVDIIDEFQATRSEASPMLSIFTAILFGAGGLMGPLMNRFNGGILCIVGSLVAFTGCVISSFSPSVAVLIFSTGVMTGIGLSVPFLLPFVLIGELFNKHRATALTIVSICPGLGGIIYPYLTAQLSIIYGWRGVFLIYGAVLLNCAPVGYLNAIVKRRLHRGTILTNTWKDILNCSLFKTPLYLVLVFCVFLLNTLFPTVNLFFIDMLNSKGFDTATGSSILSINAFSNMAGRLLIVFLGPFLKVSRIAQWAVYLGIVSVSVSFYVYASTYITIVATSVIYGFFWGMSIVSYPAMILELSGTKRYASALGYCNLIGGIGGLIGGPIAGLVKDITGSYDLIYFGTTALGVLASVLLMIMYIKINCKKADGETSDVTDIPEKFRYIETAKAL